MFGGVYAIITDKKGRILLQLRSKYDMFDRNKWAVLSGTNWNPFTKPEACLRRELQEELHITPKKIFFFKKMWRFLIIPSYIFHLQLNIKEPVQIFEGQAAKYVAKKEMQQMNISSYTKKILKEWFDKKDM